MLRLRDFKHVPKLLYVDYDTHTFYMEYGGNKLTSSNIPSDWKDQIVEIITGLRERGINHNDIKDAELLVKDDGSIMLIDYGWASPVKGKIGDPICSTPIKLNSKLVNGIGGGFRAPGHPDDRYSIIKAVLKAQGVPSDNATISTLINDLFGQTK